MDSSPGLAAEIITQFIEAGVYSKRDFKCKKGMYRFRCSHYVGLMGIVCLLFVLGTTYSAITDASQRGAAIFVSVLFAVPSIPTLLLYLVAKVWLGEDKLVTRNLIGIKKTIYWRDITETYQSRDGGEFIVRAGKKKVWLYTFFKGSCIIESVVEEKTRENPHNIKSRNEYEKFVREDGTVILRGRKLYAVIGIAILLCTIGCIFLSVEGQWIAKAVVVALFAILGTWILLFYLMLRLYMDAEKVTYRNTFGITKKIRWVDFKHAYNEKNLGQPCITLKSKDNRIIRLYKGYLDGYEHIHRFIRQFHPGEKHKPKNHKRK